jgi:hypothetical protein
MKRIITVAVVLLCSTIAAEAAARVVITAPTSRSNAEILCPWVTGSVSPTWPQAQQSLMLGVCPPQRSPR